MNEYPYTPYAVAGVTLLVVSVIALLLWRSWKATHVPWEKLPNYYPGTQWYSRVDTDPKFIAQALIAAETFLINRTKWGAANLALVGHHVSVYVMDTEVWVDMWGRTVAGLQNDGALIVGPSLSALCHEMAHLCEQVLDKTVDMNHDSWAGDGIQAALNDYDQWLTQKRLGTMPAGVISLPGDGAALRGMQACRFQKPA